MRIEAVAKTRALFHSSAYTSKARLLISEKRFEDTAPDSRQTGEPNCPDENPQRTLRGSAENPSVLISRESFRSGREPLERNKSLRDVQCAGYDAARRVRHRSRPP